ncbi:MAG TPA: hypothetical protein VLU46_06345, partial [Thermoanaerobaculia bacterium]|nr:hypothetical protein [Thermoanaerobaculia bacterium]
MVRRLALVIFLAACASSTQSRVSNLESRISPQWDLANLPFWRVDYWVDRFTSDKRAEFAQMLQRKQQYQSMISAKLRERAMPQDLVSMAMI